MRQIVAKCVFLLMHYATLLTWMFDAQCQKNIKALIYKYFYMFAKHGTRFVTLMIPLEQGCGNRFKFTRPAIVHLFPRTLLERVKVSKISRAGARKQV